MGEPERGLTPNGVVARDGDGGGEFIIERDMATERSADERSGDESNPTRRSLDYARAVTSTKSPQNMIRCHIPISLQTWR